MSDLTRYCIQAEAGPFADPTNGKGPYGHGTYPEWAYKWVKAEEAEARIAELEAKIERLTNRGIEDMKFTIAEQEARLRAADKLADAVYQREVAGPMNLGRPSTRPRRTK